MNICPRPSDDREVEHLAGQAARRRAGHGAPDEDVHSDVEPRAVRTSGRLRRRVAPRASTPVGEIGEAHRRQHAVGDDHALGPAGRAGRCRTARRDRRARAGRALAAPPPAKAAAKASVPATRVSTPAGAAASARSGVATRSRAPRVLDDPGDLARMELGVDRHGGGAGPPRSRRARRECPACCASGSRPARRARSPAPRAIRRSRRRGRRSRHSRRRARPRRRQRRARAVGERRAPQPKRLVHACVLPRRAPPPPGGCRVAPSLHAIAPARQDHRQASDCVQPSRASRRARPPRRGGVRAKRGRWGRRRSGPAGRRRPAAVVLPSARRGPSGKKHGSGTPQTAMRSP